MAPGGEGRGALVEARRCCAAADRPPAPLTFAWSAGRKGKTGIATTFINKQADEHVLLDLKHLLKEAKQRVPPVLQALHDPMEELLVSGGAQAEGGRVGVCRGGVRRGRVGGQRRCGVRLRCLQLAGGWDAGR